MGNGEQETVVVAFLDGVANRINSFGTEQELRAFLVSELNKPDEQFEQETLREVRCIERGLARSS